MRELRAKSSQKNFSSALRGKGLSGVTGTPIHPDQTDLSQGDKSSVESPFGAVEKVLIENLKYSQF